MGRDEESKQALRRVSELHANLLEAEKRARFDAETHVPGTR